MFLQNLFAIVLIGRARLLPSLEAGTRRRLSRSFALPLVMLGLFATSAAAHKPSDSYLRLQAGEGPYLTIEWDIALKDLEYVIGLDANADGAITWGELSGARGTVTSYALSKLQLLAGAKICRIELQELRVARHSDGAYASLALATNCPANAAELGLRYHLFFAEDPTHRGLVSFTSGAVTSTYVLSKDSPALTLDTAQPNLLSSFAMFVKEGVWHIWIGYDHILFLAALLLPAVFERRDAAWRPVTAFRPTYLSVLKIVTMFTLAHSITLWLSVMGYVTLPSQWVESAIALSIVITAINNLYPVLPVANWSLAFGFGLIHGFGFANVLLDLGLSSGSLAMGLLGFNIGVELGQLAIVLVLLPLMFAVRETVFYRHVVFRCGSVAVAVMGLVWMIERIGNVSLLGS